MMRLVWACLMALVFLPARVWAQDDSFDSTFVYEAEQALSHQIGSANGDGWAASTALSAGHLAYGPYATTWGQGGGKAVFRLMIDNRSADNVRVLTVDVYDADMNEILATRDIRRQEFDAALTYQDFELWFELRARVGHRMETRVYWHDTAYIKLDKVTVHVDGLQPGLPRLYNLSASSDTRATALMDRAIRGLGFNSAAFDGPNAGDLVFVGKYYMAWIDQTGFEGKMNALWVLNGAAGDALDFVHVEPLTNRPVSFLGVAEDGDGRWLAGYRGAEHFEVPHEVPEPGEDPNGNGQCDVSESCSGTACERSICNWYSMNEAAPVTDPDVPNWSSCNANRMTWARKTVPEVETQSGRSLTLVYEGPLVKGADAAKDGAYDGDNCHRDYLFPDGVRRKVYLRVGYVLHGDRDYFDRTYQFRNPAGNPSLGDEAWSLIGGLVITKYPSTQPHKEALFHTVRPDKELSVGGKTYAAGKWTMRERLQTGENADDVWAWLATPISWSARGRYSRGDSLRMEHLGPSDNDDVGFCICRVHGGFEIGGGVLHRDQSPPIGPGSLSIEAIRRISLPSLHNPPFVYETESLQLSKHVGRQDADGWSANTAWDPAGRLLHGPYATTWGAGPMTAVFRMMVDNVSADQYVVATLDVYDATANQVLASRQIRRNQFSTPLTYADFSLDFNLQGRSGHAIETRIWWNDISYLKVDKVTLFDR
jgi:hypothetical protein